MAHRQYKNVCECMRNSIGFCISSRIGDKVEILEVYPEEQDCFGEIQRSAFDRNSCKCGKASLGETILLHFEAAQGMQERHKRVHNGGSETARSLRLD